MIKDRHIMTSEFGPAPIDEPNSYPGRRPNYSYVFCGDKIFPIDITYGKPIEELLIDTPYGKDISLEDKYAVLGYGSNVCPSQLSQKFTDNTMFPVIRGILYGYDVVYAAGIASYGSVPATLIRSPQTTVEVWINILDAEQLCTLDKTESRGRRYDMILLDEIILENGEIFNPICSYMFSKGPMTCIENSPTRIKNIRSNKSQFTPMTQEEVLQTLPVENTKCVADMLTQNRYNTVSDKFNIIPVDSPPSTISETSRSFAKQNMVSVFDVTV